MRKGDLGDKFYIILHGVIDVWIPTQNEEITITEKEKINLQLKYNMIKLTKMGQSKLIYFDLGKKLKDLDFGKPIFDSIFEVL